jgi:hypothetical protein
MNPTGTGGDPATPDDPIERQKEPDQPSGTGVPALTGWLIGGGALCAITYFFVSHQHRAFLYSGVILGVLGILAYIVSPISLKDRFKWLKNGNNWLTAIAILMPVLGYVWMTIFAYTTKGQHQQFLGAMYMVGLASLIGGAAVGFLFGVPKSVSSGDARQASAKASNQNYLPSSNLAEISDWLTKLLLGAGLVSITKLGDPLSKLVDDVAAGFKVAAASPSMTPESMKVMAGAIMIAFVLIGFLDGYVVTTLWYQKQLNRDQKDQQADEQKSAPVPQSTQWSISGKVELSPPVE